MQFPKIQSYNLEGRKYQLPEDFEGEVNLLLIAFHRWQQQEVDTWVPFARQLLRENPSFRYYEIPTINRSIPLFRMWLDNAMRLGIPDRQAREATITLYLDKLAFRKSLAIPNETNIQALLVNRAGEILWRSKGQFSEDKGQSLRQVIEGLKKAALES